METPKQVFETLLCVADEPKARQIAEYMLNDFEDAVSRMGATNETALLALVYLCCAGVDLDKEGHDDLRRGLRRGFIQALGYLFASDEAGREARASS